MRSCRVLSAIVAVMLATGLSASAKVCTLQDIQDLPSAQKPAVDTSKSFSNDHWAYKTLENVSKKYGLMLGKPGDKFDGQAALTRNEAAVILVNLNGKIEQENLQLSDSEKAQIEILKQELQGETQKLVGRVDNLEGSVNALKGSVTNLQASDKKNLKYGFGQDMKIAGGMQTMFNGSIQRGDDNYAPNFSIPLIEVNVSGKLYPHLNYYIQAIPSRRYDSGANGILGNAFIATDIIPHHTIQAGQTRVPIGYEGPQSPYKYDTVQISQISRKFSAYRDTGVKVLGNWKFMDYYLGAYNGSGNNSNDTNTSMDMIGFVSVKPLANAPKLGHMELGGGVQQGQANPVGNTALGTLGTRYARQTYNAYGRYKYKKFETVTEYATRNGYGAQGVKADGFYTNVSYFVTPKTQLLARLDRFDPNRSTVSNHITEYTLGGNYYLSNLNLKLMCNLVYVKNDAAKDAERIVLQAQYKF
ncbi:MAG: porin [Candidatus Gastranaerophilales bacterium]|nr:porin [Candidatus Gastranaerophilales bacterium]